MQQYRHATLAMRGVGGQSNSSWIRTANTGDLPRAYSKGDAMPLGTASLSGASRFQQLPLLIIELLSNRIQPGPFCNLRVINNDSPALQSTVQEMTGQSKANSRPVANRTNIASVSGIGSMVQQPERVDPSVPEPRVPTASRLALLITRNTGCRTLLQQQIEVAFPLPGNHSITLSIVLDFGLRLDQYLIKPIWINSGRTTDRGFVRDDSCNSIAKKNSASRTADPGTSFTASSSDHQSSW